MPYLELWIRTYCTDLQMVKNTQQMLQMHRGHCYLIVIT